LAKSFYIMPRFVASIFSNALQNYYIINQLKNFLTHFIFKDVVLDLSVFYNVFHVTNYSISLN
jgi:hypothetical protein